jgi:integrase
VSIGNVTHLDIEDARGRAREVITALKEGRDTAGPESFAAVSEEWFKRHVSKLISANAIRGYFTRYFLPEWSGRDFQSIRRGDVTKMLDTIEDQSGASAATHALAHLSGVFSWYALRNENYASPIIRGMRRTSAKERARKRILSDDEIRTLWKVRGTIGDLIKLLLLTAQRKDKVASMKWADISNGTWSVPNGDRQKGTGGDLVLPGMALDIINARPRFASNPYVFAARGGAYWRRYSEAVKELPPLPHWTLHDLRRTARSLMSRAGVRPDIAERVLGHAIGGVEGVYDRHHYQEAKADALKRLAGLIDAIINPPADNVVSLRAAP